MREILMAQLGPFVMGALLGIAYTRGACMTLNIASSVWKMALVLVGLAALASYVGFQVVTAAMVVGVGLSVVIMIKLAYMKYRLPRQLAVASLAARPGEEEPGVGRVDGLWVLCYSNGQTFAYDQFGKLKRIGFPDGSQWELVEPRVESS